jgi:beta-glucosidase
LWCGGAVTRFLWGASTSAHQIEGGNVHSDWWELEHTGHWLVREPSLRAADSWNRWEEDLDLLAGAGFNAYRFSVEWARVEPEPGARDLDAVNRYRKMVSGARARGLAPVVTLHHFTGPAWFARQGGWADAAAPAAFERWVEMAAEILAEGAQLVCTINEPNILALTPVLLGTETRPSEVAQLLPDVDAARNLVEAHQRAVDVVRQQLPGTPVGWTVACHNFQPSSPDAEDVCAAYAKPRQTDFLAAAKADDFIGVQTYTRRLIGVEGDTPVPLPPPEGSPVTQTRWEYYPQALEDAVRTTAADVPGVPIVVTENGIATADDEQRRAYTALALEGLLRAVGDGIDVRGYLHWSLLDNYEWGSYQPTFGLVAVEPATCDRIPKPSLRWLGALDHPLRDRPGPEGPR